MESPENPIDAAKYLAFKTYANANAYSLALSIFGKQPTRVSILLEKQPSGTYLVHVGVFVPEVNPNDPLATKFVSAFKNMTSPALPQNFTFDVTVYRTATCDTVGPDKICL